MAELLLQLLTGAVLLALATTGLVALLRVLPYVRAWTARGVRPFACDACMAFWTVATLTIATRSLVGSGVLWAAVPAYGLALLLLSHLGRMPASGPPIGRPDHDEELLR